MSTARTAASEARVSSPLASAWQQGHAEHSPPGSGSDEALVVAPRELAVPGPARIPDKDLPPDYRAKFEEPAFLKQVLDNVGGDPNNPDDVKLAREVLLSKPAEEDDAPKPDQGLSGYAAWEARERANIKSVKLDPTGENGSPWLTEEMVKDAFIAELLKPSPEDRLLAKVRDLEKMDRTEKDGEGLLRHYAEGGGVLRPPRFAQSSRPLR
jgi:hypothetical protein